MEPGGGGGLIGLLPLFILSIPYAVFAGAVALTRVLCCALRRRAGSPNPWFAQRCAVRGARSRSPTTRRTVGGGAHSPAYPREWSPGAGGPPATRPATAGPPTVRRAKRADARARRLRLK